MTPSWLSRQTNVTPAVLNRQDHEDKLNTMLEDGTYKKLKKDPTSKVERPTSEALKVCQKKGNMTRNCKLRLTPKTSVLSQLYGLPRIHKVGVPLRSTIGLPTYVYNLAKWLGKILLPLAGKTKSNVKNSVHFAQMIREMTFKLWCGQSLHKGTSWWDTGRDCYQALRRWYLRRKNISDTTSSMPPDKICLISTYFQFMGEFFEQLEGATMGSPPSPIKVNLFTESLEEKASPQKPRIWDDTFVVWPHGKENLHKFQEHLMNNIPTWSSQQRKS